MILTQALIDKLTAWQAAGNFVYTFREGRSGMEEIPFSDLRCGVDVYVYVWMDGYDVAVITESNWYGDFETVVLEETIRKCREKIRSAKDRLAQIRMEVA